MSVAWGFLCLPYYWEPRSYLQVCIFCERRDVLASVRQAFAGPDRGRLLVRGQPMSATGITSQVPRACCPLSTSSCQSFLVFKRMCSMPGVREAVWMGAPACRVSNAQVQCRPHVLASCKCARGQLCPRKLAFDWLPVRITGLAQRKLRKSRGGLRYAKLSSVSLRSPRPRRGLLPNQHHHRNWSDSRPS